MNFIIKGTWEKRHTPQYPILSGFMWPEILLTGIPTP